MGMKELLRRKEAMKSAAKAEGVEGGRVGKPPRPTFNAINPQCDLYVSDALAVLPYVPRASVDLALLDPPFNIGEPYGGEAKSDKMDWEDYIEFMKNLIYWTCHAVRPSGALFMHVPDEIVDVCSIQLKANGMTLINWIILHQEFGQYNESRFIRSKVHLLYFAKPGLHVIGCPQCKGSKCKACGNTGSTLRGMTWNIEDILEPSTRLTMGDKRIDTAKYKGKRPFLDVWYGPHLGKIQGNNEERMPRCPNQLPEMYIARILRAASSPGDLVLDPTVGSGTVPTVARALGRRFIGCERSTTVAKYAWDRVIMRGPVRDVKGPLVVPGYKAKLEI